MPYLSHTRLSSIPVKDLVKLTEGRHPSGAIALRLSQYEAKLNDFIGLYEVIDKGVEEQVAEKFRELNYAAFELIEAFQTAFECVVHGNKKMIRKFKNSCKGSRDKIAVLTNYCKHSHNEVRLVKAEQKDLIVYGFCLLEGDEGCKVKLNAKYHSNGKATSFRKGLMEIVTSVLIIDRIVFEGVNQVFGSETTISVFNEKDKQEVFEKLRELNNNVFPSEIHMPLWVLHKSSQVKFKLHTSKLVAKTFKQTESIRITASYKADGMTSSFPIPNI